MYAQGPNAPEAASFEPVDATDMVNLVTGDLSYVLPLLNVPSPEGGYPIALSYHAGIAMDQEASWVGLGWSLNPGAINRGVNGYPDDWGKANVNEFFYDQGWFENYYNIGAGVTFSGGVSVGLGLSWGSNQSLGGYVSAGIGPGDGKTGASLGVIVGTDGASIYGGVGQFSASVGTNGVGIGYGTIVNGNTSIGMSLNYSYNSGLSGGISVNQKAKNGSTSWKNSGVGISLSSNGVSVNAKMNGYGAGISSSTNAISAGDYDVNVSTSGFYIPVYIFYVSYSNTKVKYSLYKYNNLYTSGMLYPVVANELNTYDNSSNLSRRMKENHFMDVNVVQKFGTGDSYKDLIDDSNKNDKNNLVLPNYDNYTVNAQGLSGSISPYIFSELNLSARGRGEQNIDNEYLQYLNHDITEYMASPSSGLGGNKEAVAKKYFTFLSEYNSFLRLETSQINKAGIFNASSDYLMKEYATYETGSFYNGSESFKNSRKREGNIIETYTNKEIRESSIIGFIEAKEGDNLLNRQDTETFLDDGIGAFKITSLDGKTYHYSLPVYQFESFYKNFKDETDEDKNFFEIQKTTPYATHWLLTAITGPDYIDNNNNGKVDENDYGYWVEFDYGKWSDGYTWQTPNGRNEEITDINNVTDKTYAYSWGRKQIYYLDAIKTRTHTALFVKDIRNDNFSFDKSKDSKKWDSGGFDMGFNGLYYYNKSKSKEVGPPGLSVYNSHGDEIVLPQSDKMGDNVDGYFSFHQMTSEYIYTPINRSLKLSKILLVKNKDIDSVIKDRGYLTETEHGFIIKSHGYAQIYYRVHSTHGTSEERFYEFGPFFTTKFNTNGFNVNIHQNIIDVKDIEGLDLESKASQVIEFEHDYSLAKNAPNTEINKGRLTLNNVSFKGKKGVKLVPPYKFSYKDPTLLYNKNDIDVWGYHKTVPDVWSLNKIETPIGQTIKLNYESDEYYSALIHRIEFLKGNGRYSFSYDVNGYYINSTEEIGLSIGKIVKLNTLIYNGSNVTKTYGDAKIISYSSSLGYKIEFIGIPTVTITPNTGYGSGGGGAFMGYAYYDIDTPFFGGGIRAQEIAIFNGDNSLLKTEYHYNDLETSLTSGITSYDPTNIKNGVPYASELPPPMVMYGEVAMLTKDGAGNELGRSVYEFETLEPRKEEEGYIFSLGEAFRVKESQNQTFEGGKVIVNKYTIESRLGNLGRIKSITSYNNKNQVLNKKENIYKKNLNNEGEIGVSQESHKSYKRLYKNDVETFYVSSTSKVNYPSVLESTKVTQSGFSIEKYFDKYDFLTGQPLETRTYASDGSAFKTKTVPAYTKYPQMGSKVDNITNKNMLTQQAASYTYLLNEANNTEKVIGAGITTWNNSWFYRDQSGLETTPTNDVEKIWRKHKSYFWKGDIDSDGAYIGYNATNDDGFVWGIGQSQTNNKWKKASEVTRYDHYSASLELMDINANFASTKMCDSDSKIMVVSNAKYTEMFYSGAEYFSLNNNFYFDGEVKSVGQSEVKAHTGIKSIAISSGQNGFEVILKGGEHRAGKYKFSVWVDKGSEA
ncbi:MAG: hypothetical protein WC389_04650, partial [Lutibacter sp.]